MNQTQKIETVAPVATKPLTVKTQLRAGRIVAAIVARPRGAVSLIRTY
jgi:hypothetical protein